MIDATNIVLSSESSVRAGYAILHAKESIMMLKDAKIISLREHTCNLDPKPRDLFTCFPQNSLADSLTDDLIIENFVTQFPGAVDLQNKARFDF